MTKLRDEEIVTLLDEEIRSAVGYSSSALSDQRKTALEYYYGEKFGNEVEGRSEYVSRDVADTIEWIMPSLMRIFTGGDQIVRFEPQGPEDEQNAQQATDYINYIFQRQNDGFLTLYTWFKDALLSKNGFVKVFWEKTTEAKVENYEGLTEDQFALLLQDENVEPIEHSEENGLHSLKVRRKEEKGKCCVVPVPPEEILVNKNPTSPFAKNRFRCHRRRVSIGELKEMGFKDVDDIQSDDGDNFNEERTARFHYDETDNSLENETKDPLSREVWLSECYRKIDVDGDGVAEERTIIIAGKKVLQNEEGYTANLITVTPIILPHKLFGMSIADLVMDIQLLKSTVFRQILDNMYLANNGRYMALDGMVNIDDLLTSRPGGIVRVKTFDAVKPMQPPLLGAPAFDLLGYIDQIKENRTGVNRAPLDPDAISKHATGAAIIDQATQARTELIARIFAETGVKDLFYAILECVQKYQDQKKVIRLRNEWIPMDPREWTNKFDLTVMVGLGTGSKQTQLIALNEETQFQIAALQGGLPIVTPENVYNLRMKALEAKNIKGGDLFYTHPTKMPPQPPQQDPALVKAQMDAEVDMKKIEAKRESDFAKREQDFAKAQAKLQQDADKMMMEASQESERIKIEAMIEKIKTDAMVQLEREKAAIQIMIEKEKQQQASEENQKNRDQQASEAANDRVERIITGFQESIATVAASISKNKKDQK